MQQLLHANGKVVHCQYLVKIVKHLFMLAYLSKAQLQGQQEREKVVRVYNQLCRTLLGLQVTLSQNKPQSMTEQDRNVAAARFQSGMQVPFLLLHCIMACF